MLQNSIERVGLLSPPYLYYNNNAQYYQIVCGLRRIQACITAGWKDITAHIIDPGSDEKELLLLSLYDNLSHRVLNPVEQARAALKLLAYDAADTVIREYLPLMGLPPTEKTLNHLLCVARLDPEIQDAVAQGRLCEAACCKACLPRRRRPEGFVQTVFRRYIAAPANRRKSSRIAWISACGRKPGAVPYCRSARYKQSSRRISCPSPRRATAYVLTFANGVFPGFHEREEKFLQQRKNLRLPAGVQLLPPPSFEGGRFRFEIEFNHTGDLQQKAEAVMSMANNQLLKDIVENNVTPYIPKKIFIEDAVKDLPLTRRVLSRCSSVPAEIIPRAKELIHASSRQASAHRCAAAVPEQGTVYRALSRHVSISLLRLYHPEYRHRLPARLLLLRAAGVS